MDRPPENLSPRPSPNGHGRRPRDLALLLLAMGTEPPRARARDQQADRAGAETRRRLLDHVAALDPDPSDLEAALASAVAALGEPTGPARGVAALLLDEWTQLHTSPAAWEWLIAEALEHSARPEGEPQGKRRRRRPDGAP